VTPETLATFDVPVWVLTESCVHLDKDRPDVSMETLYGDVRAIATIFGVEDGAAALIEGWEARIAAVADETEGAAPTRVFLYDSGEDQPFTAGRFAMPTALIEAAGGTNVMDDVDMSWGRVGWEAVGERDPEFIIVLDYGEDGGAGLIAFLEAHPVMSQTAAVRNRRYLALKYAEITPGPANIGAVEKIARALRPGMN
jgi:iron complex transport system substrate-binding protein